MTTPTETPAMSPVVQIEKLHERLEKARQIVAEGRVHPVLNREGYYVVLASSGDGFYLVNATCECPDYGNKKP